MKKIFVKTLIIFIAIALLLHMPFAIAASDGTEELKDMQEENNEKIEETKQKKEEVEKEKTQTQTEVDKLSSQIEDYQNQIDELDTKISDLNKQIEESQNKLNKAQEDYTKQEELLEARLVASYEGGETSYLDILLSSDSITKFISNYFLITEVAQADAEILENIEKQKQEIEQAKTNLENSKKELDTSKAQKQSMSTQLQTAKDEKSKYVSQLSAEEQELQKEIDQLTEDNRKILNEIKIAQEKYKKQLEDLQNSANNKPSNGGSNGGSSSGSGIFIRPVNGGTITCNGYYSSGKFHGAIDYAINSGTPVYAAADGVVMSIKSLTSSYGTHVVIQHANGLQTWYAHGTPGSVCVSLGQTVRQGQQIMKSGNSGNSSGPHLHFEVRRSPYNYSYSAKRYGDDSRVNPNLYF